MKKASPCPGYRFTPAIIARAVWLYHRYRAHRSFTQIMGSFGSLPSFSTIQVDLLSLQTPEDSSKTSMDPMPRARYRKTFIESTRSLVRKAASRARQGEQTPSIHRPDAKFSLSTIGVTNLRRHD